MATYRIKAPDGNTYRIDGPDGASEAEIRARVLADHPKAAEPSAARKMVAAEDAKLRAEGGTSPDRSLENFFAGMGKSVTDTGLGLRQFAASFGLGDKEALSKEAAEKDAIDTPLMNTAGGMAGKYGTDLAATIAPMGALTKLANARFLPNAVSKIGRLARVTAPSAAVGAAEGALTPGENYDLLQQAGMGALTGAAFDVGGRGVGRIISPRLAKAAAGTKQWVDDLRAAKLLPKPTLANLTDNEMARQFSDALSKVPVFSAELQAAQGANRGALTKYQTGRAGIPMEDTFNLAPIKDALSAEAAVFRSGPRISLGHIPAKLLPIQAELATDVATGFASKSPLTRTTTALRDVTQTPTYSANRVMDIRQKLVRLGYASQGADKLKYKELQEIYEDALRKQHGPKFDEWKKKFGDKEDLLRAVEKGGVDSKQRLRPSALQSEVAGTAEAARGTHPYLVRAADARIPDPVGQENRSLLTNILLGGGIAAGGGMLGAAAGYGAGQRDFGDLATSAGLGLVGVGAAGKTAGKLLGTEGGARYIMGEARGQSQAMRDFLRKLLASGAIVGGDE